MFGLYLKEVLVVVSDLVISNCNAGIKITVQLMITVCVNIKLYSTWFPSSFITSTRHIVGSCTRGRVKSAMG